jgi:transcriptional regulator with XRE-family HTH domain
MNKRNPIRERRLAKGLSQKVLGEAVGVNQATVAKWERLGQVPRSITLVRLRAVLGLTASDIADLTAPAQPATGEGATVEGPQTRSAA